MAKGIPKHGDDLLGEIRSHCLLPCECAHSPFFLKPFVLLVFVLYAAEFTAAFFQQLCSHEMAAYTSGSRRPRLYVFVAGFFLAVLGLSFVGFHDVSRIVEILKQFICLQRSEYKEYRRISMG